MINPDVQGDYVSSEPKMCGYIPPALTTASNMVLAAAKYIVAKIKDTIALAGGRAFFVPAGFTWRNIMTEAQETSENEVMPEWLAAQTFESLADTVPLDDMPNNDDSAKRGISVGTWMRACGFVLQDDDKQLYEIFKDDESAEFWFDVVEDLAKFIDREKAGSEIIEACRTRLLVCASHYAEENFPEGGDA